MDITEALNSAIPPKYHVWIIIGAFAYSHRGDVWAALKWIKSEGGLRKLWNDFLGPKPTS